MVDEGEKESSESKPAKEKTRQSTEGPKGMPRLSARPKKLKAKAESQSTKKEEPLSEAKQMIRRIEEMYGELEDKLQYVYDHIHLLPDDLQKIVHQPEVFVGEHKKILEIFEKDLEAKVINVLGESKFEAQKKRLKKKRAKKGRRAQKLRGKKRWIPLQ